MVCSIEKSKHSENCTTFSERVIWAYRYYSLTHTLVALGQKFHTIIWQVIWCGFTCCEATCVCLYIIIIKAYKDDSDHKHSIDDSESSIEH